MDYDVSKDIKDQDIQACMNPMSQGFIYIDEGMRDLIAEIKNYPQGLTKDLIDMLGKLNKYFWKRDEAPPRKREGRPQQGYEVSRVTAY